MANTSNALIATAVLPDMPSEDRYLAQLAAIEHIQMAQSEQLERVTRQLAEIANRPLKITNFDMPFFALVGFIVKFAIASIPAAFIIAIIYFVIFLGFGSAFLGALRGG